MKLQHQYAGSDWLKQQGLKAEKVTPFACLVADILGLVFKGLYHIRESVHYKKSEWYKSNFICIQLYRTISTYDCSELTELVLLCHQLSIRLEIGAVMTKRVYEGEAYDAPAIELRFSPRKPEGQFWERHSSIEEAIAKFQQFVVTEEEVAA